MVFNKITLAFPEKDEILFRKKYFSDSIIQFRIAFLLVTVLYAAFGYLDIKVVPEFAELFHVIRFYFVVPLLSLVFLLSFTGLFRKIWQLLLFICFIVSGAGISVMTTLVPENYSYYAGMMLIFSAGYFFIKLRFLLATIAGWTTLIIFNIGSVFYAHASSMIIINNNFFFISTNLIGMFAAYNIEYYARRNFDMNQELDRQKTAVEDVNKNLEKTVVERTKDLMEAKNKAEQSDRLKTAFMNNISHEIRTPLNGILGFSELMAVPDITDKEREQYFSIVKSSSSRLINTVTDYMDMSLITSGNQEVQKLEFAPGDLLDEIYTIFRPASNMKNLALLLQMPTMAGSLKISSDKELLRKVLSHLLDNAIKFTKQGTISFGFNVKGNVLVFFVRDTGIGINQAAQPTIFDKFMQENTLDTRDHDGSGLGLSISQGIVHLLGGEIKVESTKGMGSVFSFTIPC